MPKPVPDVRSVRIWVCVLVTCSRRSTSESLLLVLVRASQGIRVLRRLCIPQIIPETTIDPSLRFYDQVLYDNYDNFDMYSHRLDSPPPPSHFRRPWSPVELESYGQLGRQRREASESSFEALDLADYAMTLQQRSNDVYATPAPSHHPHYPEYPPTPPRSLSLATRSNYSGPPSLVSGGSSAPSHATSRRLQTPTHRPYSLPVASRKSSSPAPASRYGGSHNYPWIADDRAPPFEAHEVDVAAFPEWSRGWYNQQKQNGLKAPYDSTFSYEPDYLLPPRLSYAPPSSSGSASQRDLLPWSMDDDGRGINVTPEMKEERVKLLEKEFAGNGNHGGQWLDDSNVVGSVDAKGKIVTSGPKKRAIFRWAEGTFAFGAAVASLYSAIVSTPNPSRSTVLINS